MARTLLQNLRTVQFILVTAEDNLNNKRRFCWFQWPISIVPNYAWELKGQNKTASSLFRFVLIYVNLQVVYGGNKK